MRSPGSRWGRLGLAAGLVLLGGCSAPTDGAAPTPPVALTALLDDAAPFARLADGEDRWEVWVCHVPADSTADPYDVAAPRATLTPAGLVRELEEHLGPWFEAVSHGRYRPAWSPGGVFALGAHDGPQQCAEAALDRSSPAADGVLAVADAPHRSDAEGGFGTPGDPCPDVRCPASDTGRVVYVGGADFHPDWGEVPALDLVEHELGHALGWPHSAVGLTGEGRLVYASGLDVMSDSAAPRVVDPARRHGPTTLAVNLLASGWIPLVDVVVVPSDGGEVELAPRTAAEGPRIGVVGLDDHRLLTIELVVDRGFDEHLPADGLAVHLVDLGGATCGRNPTERCGPLERSQRPLVGSPPHTDLLTPGESWVGEGWRVQALDDGPRWRVAVVPSS